MTTDARPTGAEWVEPNPPPTWRPGDDPLPAPPPPPAPVAAPAPVSRESEEPASGAEARSGESMRRFMDRLMRPGTSRGAVQEPADDDAGDGAEAPDGAPPRATTGEAPGAPGPAGQTTGPPPQPPQGDPPLSAQARRAAGQLKTLDPADLVALAQTDGPFKEALEAEITRRAHAAGRQAADRAQLTRAQQRAALLERERQIRPTDAYEAARLRDEADAMTDQDQFLVGMVKAYDRVSLDPLMEALPEPDRKLLLEAMPPGMDGRKYVTEQAIRRLRANEARRLLRSPAFRKQVLALARGDSLDGGEEEPELGADRRAQGSRPTNGKSPMDAFIRQGFGQRVEAG